MNSLIQNIANGFTSFFTASMGREDPVVRLFQVEYAKEYNQLVDMGVEVNRQLALDHMSAHRM